MKNIIGWGKNMYQEPLEVFEHFSNSHLLDRTDFKNFKISLWEHLINTFVYFFYHNLNLVYFFINRYDRKEKSLLLKKGLKLSTKLCYQHFYLDLKAMYNYLYVQIRYHLNI